MSFQLRKQVNIDLSHLVELTDISKDYDVIDSDNQYEHHSVINVDSDQYDVYYLNDDKILVNFNKQWYFMELRYYETSKSQAEYDVLVEKLSQACIDFEDGERTVTFDSLTNGELLYVTEYVKESIDDDYVDTKSDILMNILKSKHEYMLNMIVEGEMLIYIGVAITEGQIL